MVGVRLIHTDGPLDSYRKTFVELYIDYWFSKLDIVDYLIYHKNGTVIVELVSETDLAAVLISGVPKEWSSKIEIEPFYK